MSACTYVFSEPYLVWVAHVETECFILPPPTTACLPGATSPATSTDSDRYRDTSESSEEVDDHNDPVQLRSLKADVLRCDHELRQKALVYLVSLDQYLSQQDHPHTASASLVAPVAPALPSAPAAPRLKLTHQQLLADYAVDVEAERESATPSKRKAPAPLTVHRSPAGRMLRGRGGRNRAIWRQQVRTDLRAAGRTASEEDITEDPDLMRK